MPRPPDQQPDTNSKLETDRQFNELHPELKGKLLDSKSPAKLKKEWNALYKKQKENQAKFNALLTPAVKFVAKCANRMASGHKEQEPLDPNKWNRNCDFGFFELKHEKRNYSVQFPWAFDVRNQPVAPDDQNNFICVVAGGDGTNCEAELSGLVCSCGEHKGHVFDIKSERPDIWKDPIEGAYSDAKNTIVCKFDRSENNFPWDRIWPHNITPQRYYVDVATCSKRYSAMILTYPDYEWEVGIGLIINMRGDTVVPTPVTKLSYKSNGRATEYGGSIRKIYDLIQLAIDEIRKLTNTLAKDAGKTNDPNAKEPVCDFDWMNPTFSLSGRWGWEEDDTGPSCDFTCGMVLKANPLVGGTLTINLLELALHLMAGWGGRFFKWLVKKIEHAIGLQISLTLEISGDLFTEITINKLYGHSRFDFDYDTGAGLYLELKLFINIDVTFFRHRIKGRVRGGAKSGVELHVHAGQNDEGVYIQMVGKFTGLVLVAEWQHYTGTSIEKMDKEETKQLENSEEGQRFEQTICHERDFYDSGKQYIHHFVHSDEKKEG